MSPPQAAPAAPARILVVEDEVVIAMDLQQQLRSMGYQAVGHATRGEQALTLADQLRPDLVLMDIQLAGEMDGIATAQQVRDHLGLPVVFVTAFAAEATLARAKLSEPYGYILKPFSTREMFTVIEMALYKHRVDTELLKTVSALRVAQEAQSQTSSRYQKILGNLHNAILLVGDDGCIEYANQFFCDMFQLDGPPEALIGKSSPEMLSLITPSYEDPAAALGRIAQIVAAGKAVHGEEVAMTGGRTFLRDFVPLVENGLSHGRLWEHRNITQRVQAEADLRSKETRLRQMVEAADLGLWEWNLENDTFYRSPEWKLQLGYRDDEIPNKKGLLGRWMQPEDARKADDLLQQFVERQIDNYRLELRMRHRDGSWRWMESRAALVSDEGGRVIRVIGSHADITQRKETELRLRRSEVLTAKAEMLASFGSWDWDLRGGESRWSDQLFRIYGRDKAAGVPAFSAWEETIHADDKQALEDCIQTALARGGAYEIEFRIHAKDTGALKHIQSRGECVLDERGQPLRIWGVDQDVTDRKLKDEAKAEAEHRYQNIFRSVMDGIITVDESQRITVLNDAAARMFGCRSEDAIGQPLDRFIPSHLREAHHAGFARFVHRQETEQPMLSGIRIQGLRVDGTQIPIEASISSFRQAGMRRFTAVLRDVSERLALEDQLRESQKMEAIGTLAGGIAHDFNNIVAAILGNALIAKEHDAQGDSGATQTSLEEIRRSALRAKSLVDQILSFSRRQSTQIQLVQLQAVVTQAYSLLRAVIPAGVQISVNLTESPVNVRVDATQIEQVLMNLCTNAWHAGASVIAIRLTATTRPPWHLPAHPDGGHGQAFAVLSVEDDGKGMDKATLERMFEPFFTTKGVGQGTGLGLAVAHGIVTRHGGSFHVQSSVGLGSTVQFCLPTTLAAPELPTPGVPKAVPSTGQTSPRVLYVDDDEALTFLLQRLLTRQGLQVKVCNDPASALELLVAEPGGFDVLVTDQNMPGAAGTELAQAALRLLPSLPVVLTSGNLTDSILETARSIGIRHVVSKPDSVESLVSVILELLRTAPKSDS